MEESLAQSKVSLWGNRVTRGQGEGGKEGQRRGEKVECRVKGEMKTGRQRVARDQKRPERGVRCQGPRMGGTGSRSGWRERAWEVEAARLQDQTVVTGMEEERGRGETGWGQSRRGQGKVREEKTRGREGGRKGRGLRMRAQEVEEKGQGKDAGREARKGKKGKREKKRRETGK